MKLRLSLLAASLAIAVSPALAQKSPLMAGPTAIASPQQKSNLVSQLVASHGLDANHSYSLTKEHPGVAGTKIVRLNHTFKGIPVWQSESVVVLNADGKVVSEAVTDRRQALTKAAGNTLAAGAGAGAGAGSEPNTEAKISAQQAIDIAVQKLAPNGTYIVAPEASLVLFPITTKRRTLAAQGKAEKALNALDLETVVNGYELAYVVKTRMTANDRPVLWDSIISAVDGHLIQQISAMHTVVGTGHSQYNGDVPINTTFDGSNYKMIDSTRGTGGLFGAMAITNANHTSSAGSVYTNATNVWGDGQQYNGGDTTNANGQTAAVNALWGLMNTYDTMKNVLGWQSLDGHNTATYIAAHVNNNYENAYYSDTCKCMFIGDGASYFYSLGSIDVIGHEMGHGVTAATSNLTYSGESGGLNESNSDINGDMVEAYARAGGTGSVIPAGNDWFVGKEIARNGVPLRFMQKPSKDGSSPDAWSTSIGGLDVHYSSGPNNRMFYFLSQGSNATPGNDAYSSYLTGSPAAMTGIGNDKAYRIWFKANTTKFTAGTDYADARNKVLQAAEELYGVGSKEAIAVTRAYAAINVGEDIDEGPQPFAIKTQPADVTVLAGFDATFTTLGKGGTAPYGYQWYKNGKLVPGATSATYSFTATGLDFNAKVNAVIKDATGASLTTNTATVTVSTSPIETQLILNGDFEAGTANWVGNTGDIGTWPNQPAFEGTKNAWMGGNGTAVTEKLYQQLTIPAAATTADLSFMLHIDTAETTKTVQYDKMQVIVQNAAGTNLKVLKTYSNLDKAAGYQQRTFDLKEFKGQTIRVLFTETEDSSLQTSFVIDKVTLLAK
ncbi:MAG: M4 family metallopeptidase [Burkholderiales bacterium]|nr:M4 family metallopeptidase [Burkholderiales bacterium]